MPSADRWMAVGSAILGVGALLAISWLIYAIQSKTNFWAWPGIIGVAIAAAGFVPLVVGFMMPRDEDRATAQQTLRSGPHSTNLQAGHDIRLGERSGNNGDAS
jgi:peptidoglycan/LPS O-acetylase OafA/YrhL